MKLSLSDAEIYSIWKNNQKNGKAMKILRELNNCKDDEIIKAAIKRQEEKNAECIRANTESNMIHHIGKYIYLGTIKVHKWTDELEKELSELLRVSPEINLKELYHRLDVGFSYATFKRHMDELKKGATV